MNARETALAVVRDVFPAEAAPIERSAQEALDYRLRKGALDARDRAFATQLAYGAIKMRRTLDWYVRPYVGARGKPLPPVIAEILRLAVYELAFTDAREHATVSEFVGLAKRYGHRGTAGLVNAVLRTFLRDRPPPPRRELFDDESDFLGTAYSFPTWLVRQLRETFGAERLEAVLDGCNKPAQSAVAVNRTRDTRDTVRAWFAQRGSSAESSPLAEDAVLVGDAALARASERTAAGRWWVQSEASAIPVDVLNPQPGDWVLDACSGRGNKALQIAARLGGEGSLVCVDHDARKAAILAERLPAAGVAASVVTGDVARFSAERTFDRVLLDAPCSGVGVVGRHPEARWRKRHDDGERLAGAQRELLSALAERVAEGGTLVYAVCSTDPRETTEVVQAFLSRPDFSRGTTPARCAFLRNSEGDLVVAPGLDGRDGFFIACLERTAR